VKQLKVDLSVPIEGGPLDGHVVIYDHDRDPEPLPSIAPTGLIPSRGFVLPVALPAGYEDASVYRLQWTGPEDEDPVYRWCPTHHLENNYSADQFRAELVDTLGAPADTTLANALGEVYELAGCNTGVPGRRHLAPNSDGYCDGCGHYFGDDDEPLSVPTTLAEAIKRTYSFRTREADQSVFNRHQPASRAITEISARKVCGTCCDRFGVPSPAPCPDYVDLARRYGFSREGLVS
jgi:hypothetical protein